MSYRNDHVLERRGVYLGPSLKRFVGALIAAAATRPVVVRYGGTSIAAAATAPGYVLIEALQGLLGDSGYEGQFAAIQANQPIGGWKAQYFAGLGSVRLRGTLADGAGALTYLRRGSTLSVLYSQEPDGADVGVSINGVAQAALPCQNATSSYGHVATYALDPAQISQIVLSPPAGPGAYGYLEHLLFGPASPFQARGLLLQAAPYGGSALGHHAGTMVRPADSGMYATAAPTGDAGLLAVFAPAAAASPPLVTPDLLIWSGPTNDYHGDPTHFAANLGRAVGYAVGNHTPVLLIIEPANGTCYPGNGGPVAGLNEWHSARAAIWAMADAYPDDVAVFDWDYALAVGAFAPHYHASDLGDPHPHDEGYGDPNTIGGAILCAALGVPVPRRAQDLPDRQARFALTDTLVSATEPLYAPLGSLWRDTSASPAGETKRKVAVLSPTARGAAVAAAARGLWELVEGGAHPNLARPILTGGPRFGSWSPTTAFGNEPATVVSSPNLGIGLTPSLLTPGAAYTLSFTQEASVVGGPGSVWLVMGAGAGPNYSYDLASDTFLAGVRSFTLVTSAPTAPVRSAVTLHYPTSDQLATLAAAGVDTTQLWLRFDAPPSNPGGTITLSQLRVEPGAAVCLGLPRPIAASATSIPVNAQERATEPVSTELGMLAGARWSDVSNGTGAQAVGKALRLVGGVTPVGSTSLQPGDNVWDVAGAVPTTLWPGALTVWSYAGSPTLATGTYGPGLASPGFQMTLAGGLVGNAGVKIPGPLGTNLASGAWYTLSFLWTFAFTAGGSGTKSVLVALATGPDSNIAFGLGNDQQTWTAGTNFANFYNTPSQAPGLWQRASLKVAAYTSGQQAAASNIRQWLGLLSYGADAVVITVCDLRLELGVSVTAG